MKEKNIRTVGIAGSTRGSGVTHLSVALANYAASGLGEKTAYVELGGHSEMMYWKKTNEPGFFTDLGVHYYPDFRREQIPVLLNRDYEKIIMDFGDAYLSFREELLRCDRKIFLLNMNPWQEFAARKLVNTVKGELWGGISPVYGAVKAVKHVKKTVEKENRIRVAEIPLIENPRCVRSEHFSCMDFLLGYAK